MIEVELTPDMLSRAKQKAKEMGRLRNSITKGEGNVAGFLGEEMVLKTFNNFKRENTYDSDIHFYHIKFEVKTKRCTSVPLSHYECSIANSNPNQKSEYYIFCRVLENYKKGWILGYIGQGDYIKKAIFRRKGEPDGDTGWKFKADCYNLPISNLKDPAKLYKVNDYKPDTK